MVSVAINGKTMTVGADGKLGIDSEDKFFGFNQGTTKIAERQSFTDARPVPGLAEIQKKNAGKPNSFNESWDNMHGEAFGLGQGIVHGAIKKGDSVQLVLSGKKPVCPDCIQDLAKMAGAGELRFMTVVDTFEGIVYYWQKGMAELQPVATLLK